MAEPAWAVYIPTIPLKTGKSFSYVWYPVYRQNDGILDTSAWTLKLRSAATEESQEGLGDQLSVIRSISSVTLEDPPLPECAHLFFSP